MYQEILYEIVIFDHILGEGGWYMNIYGRILLRPERSSAARRCACFLLDSALRATSHTDRLANLILGTESLYDHIM